jgi:hypothetical protein
MMDFDWNVFVVVVIACLFCYFSGALSWYLITKYL